MGKGGIKIQFYMHGRYRMNKSEDNCSKPKKVRPTEFIYIPKILIFQNVGKTMEIATN